MEQFCCDLLAHLIERIISKTFSTDLLFTLTTVYKIPGYILNVFFNFAILY